MTYSRIQAAFRGIARVAGIAALIASSCLIDAVFAAGPATNAAPVVAFSAPGNGATFRAPVDITLVALPYDSDGSVIRVDFLNGTSPIGTSPTISPWQTTWTNVQPGTYTITARATDNAQATGIATITITVLPQSTQAPQAVLTSPLCCAVYTAPTQIVFKADAYSPNGIQRVEFLSGQQVVGSATVAPYQAFWNNVPWGTYQVSVRATDRTGLVSTSPPITVTVNSPPTLTITSPLDLSKFTSPANITVSANANDPDGTITQVDFYLDGSLLRTLTTAPYQFTWQNVAPGDYNVSARTVDNRGAVTVVAANRVHVSANMAPKVQITSPLAGATLDAPSNTTITATASDPDGVVLQVEFFVDSVSKGKATAAPYSVPWIGAAPGTYTLTAVVTDDGGASVTSDPVSVKVAFHTDPGETVTFLHSDFTGNAIAATDTTGALLWKENYRPYGERMRREPLSASNRQWFSDKAEDETGLLYFGSRYYDPSVGRFLGRDAEGFHDKNIQSFNRYVYANGNPYKWIDPDGRSPIDAAFAIWDGGKLVGAIAAWTVGIATGDQTLAHVAAEGIRETRLDAGISLGAIVLPVSSPMLKGAIRGAEEIAEYSKLTKRLASEAQMAEAGIAIAGPGSKAVFRDAERVAAEHGGQASDWAKMTSSTFRAEDGVQVQTHWVQNIQTGERVEFKTIVSSP